MKNKLIKKLASKKAVSKWDKAVILYANELLENIEGEAITESILLNGAEDWTEFSFGGCALIYDADICERVCTPSEIRRKKKGELPPNSRESWLECQTRALKQASRLLLRLAKYEQENLKTA